MTSSYFVTVQDTRGNPLLPASEVQFSEGLEPVRRVLHAFVNWAVAHAASSPPEPNGWRSPTEVPNAEGFFDSDPHPGEIVRKLQEGARRTPHPGDLDA